MGIQGKHHHLLDAIGLDVGNGRFRKGMPVAHRDIGGRFNPPLTQFTLELAGLLFSDPAQGRTASDGSVGLLRLIASECADQPGERLLQSRDRKTDDLRICEQVVEEWPHILNPFRASEIEQKDADPGHETAAH